MRRELAWKRFWGPFGDDVHGDENGYLFDPDADVGKRMNPRVVTLEALADTRCLVLLGDPGMGKSIELAREIERLRAAGATVEKLDLALFTDETRLLHQAFESARFSEWRVGSGVLTLLFDALDESLINVRTFGPNLLDRLSTMPLERLRLRIVCRSADWPRVIDEGLRHSFTSDHFARYELLPLRRSDVELAAQDAGLDTQLFFEALDRTDTHALATRPLTLEMLVTTAGSHGGELPSSRVALFARATRKLSSEHHELYPTQGWQFDASQRLVAAGRISAASVLCGRPRMLVKSDGVVGSGELDANLLSGGGEACAGTSLPIAQRLVEETLRTALFTGAAVGAVTLTHRTIAEYLAAGWLVANGITGDRALPLLCHAANEKKIVPQLRGVAAWLASLHRGTLECLTTIDPLLLLGADAPMLDDAARASTVAGLLAQMDALTAHDGDFRLRRGYAKLAHPDLDAQLRPYINDETKNPVVRRVAIDIAEACGVRTLEHLLLALALDRSADYGARHQAISALEKIGSPDARTQLRPLLGAADDPSDELLGCTISALWPSQMTSAELFGTLRPRQNTSYFGTYAAFLVGLTERLSDADVGAAAEWAAANALAFRDEQIIGDIASRARRLLDDAAVRASYGRLVVSLLEEHAAKTKEQFAELDAAHRRAVLPLVLETIGDDWRLAGFLGLLCPGDVAWLPNLLDTQLPTVVRGRLIRSLRDVLGFQLDAADIDAVVTASQRHADLADAIAPYITPVEIDSELATQLRTAHARAAALSTPRALPLRHPPRSERIDILLNRLEAGELDAWWSLAEELTRRGDHGPYSGELRTRIAAEPGWLEADQGTRSRIVTGARCYLEGRNAEAAEWLGKNIVYYPALGGYRALHLLAEVEPSQLDALANNVWRAWAPAIVGLRSIGSAPDATFCDLARRSYCNAPCETLASLMQLLEDEDREHGQIFIGHLFTLLWDVRVERALRVRLGGRRLHGETVREILTLLLSHESPRASDICDRMLRNACRRGAVAPKRLRRAASTYLTSRWRKARASSIQTSRRLAILLCEAVLEGRPKEARALMWRWILNDEAFGREVMLHVATRADLRSNTWLAAMTEESVADLCLWMRRVFPRESDPVVRGGHVVSPREAAGMLRDRLVQHLRDRKTLAARDELRRIAEITGDKSVLLHAADAEAMALADTWMPPAVADLLALAARPHAQLVASGAQLLDIVVASLRRIEVTLQGELSEVQFLWDEQPGGALRPKDEGALSDFIAARLEADLSSRGVIINREVQIRPRRGGRPGERTDIHVDVVVPGTTVRIRVIIEVKGNWNKELETAIDTQLANRYLAQNQCRHGIYLVGWFDSANWDPKDRRRRAAGARPLDATRDGLERQAAARSSDSQRLEVVVMNARM